MHESLDTPTKLRMGKIYYEKIRRGRRSEKGRRGEKRRQKREEAEEYEKGREAREKSTCRSDYSQSVNDGVFRKRVYL